jgi:hypothetical protein
MDVRPNFLDEDIEDVGLRFRTFDIDWPSREIDPVAFKKSFGLTLEEWAALPDRGMQNIEEKPVNDP